MPHTPGPWKIGFGGLDGDNYATITSDFSNYPVCQLEPLGYNHDNARLIAAAPELLEACESILNTEGAAKDGVEEFAPKDPTRPALDWKWHYDKVRAAIASATR